MQNSKGCFEQGDEILMKIATWNVERLKHFREIDKIHTHLSDVNADILVLTETDTRIFTGFKYQFHTLPLLELQPNFYQKTERRVSLYTHYRCVQQMDTYDNHTAICLELETELGNLLVYGTIMGILGNREKSFQTDLLKQMEDIGKLSADGKDICVIGDYNLTFSDYYYYTKFGRELVEDIFKDCRIRILTRNSSECIDHISISESFISDKGIAIYEWNQDKKLSDHKGIVIEIN